jgi:hypothetical protein
MRRSPLPRPFFPLMSILITIYLLGMLFPASKFLSYTDYSRNGYPPRSLGCYVLAPRYFGVLP